MSCLDLTDALLMREEISATTPEERRFYQRARAFWRDTDQPTSQAHRSPRLVGPLAAPR